MARQPQAQASAGKDLSETNIKLQIEEISTGRFVYKVIDRSSGNIIRQLPTEHMLEMRAYLAEQNIRLVDETTWGLTADMTT